MTGQQSFVVEVARVIEETDDACSLELRIPADAADKFHYKPGQYLTLRIPSDRDGAVARSYSLASCPATGEPHKVTVKRVDGGYGSNWICDNVSAGDTIQVLPPAGTFVPPSLDEDLLLFAGGSGITPVISICKSVIHDGSGHVVLVYANRDERSVIFRDELNALVQQFPDRFQVVHWLESVQGLPTVASLRGLAAPHTGRKAFICGPGPYMEAVEKALAELDVPAENIFIERFVSLTDDPMAEAPDAADADLIATVEVTLDGEVHELQWPSNRKLVDLLLDNGLDAPYSCREGHCSACACVLVEGDVSMDNNDVLEQEDLDEGIFLSCQARPKTERVRASYDA
jgi:3-ketosteroid 9alpha-monooxygenase subunit B